MISLYSFIFIDRYDSKPTHEFHSKIKFLRFSRKRKNSKIMIEEPKWYLYFMINSKYNNAKELIPTLFGDFSCFSGNEVLIVVLLFKYIMVKYCNRDQTCMQAGGTRGKPSVICGFKVV
jgi:hypothetical protein